MRAEILERAVLGSNAEETERLVRDLLDRWVGPMEITDKGRVPGVKRAWGLFVRSSTCRSRHSGDAVKMAVAVLEPEFTEVIRDKRAWGRWMIPGPRAFASPPGRAFENTALLCQVL